MLALLAAVGGIEFSFDYWILLLAPLIPFGTAVIRAVKTPEWFSGLITISLAVALALGRQLFDTGFDNFVWEVALGDFIQAWGAALVTWIGVSKEHVAALHEKLDGGPLSGIGAWLQEVTTAPPKA